MSEETTEKDAAAERRAAHVAALEFERSGYERRGLKDRVAQVDAQLAELGKSPKGRSPGKRETTEG